MPPPIDVQALAVGLDGAVGLLGPLLAVGAVAGVDVDLGAVGVAVAGHVQAQALVADQRGGGDARRRPGSTVQVNAVLAEAPVPSVAVTVTVEVPAVVGVPVIVPVLEIDGPGGQAGRGEGQRLAAVGVGWRRPVPRPRCPAMPSCGPGLVIVTGWPSWADGDRQGAGQRQVRVGVADRDRRSCRCWWPRRCCVEFQYCRFRWVSGNVTVWLAPGGQADPLEALELARRLAGGGRVGRRTAGRRRPRPASRCWSRSRVTVAAPPAVSEPTFRLLNEKLV